MFNFKVVSYKHADGTFPLSISRDDDGTLYYVAFTGFSITAISACDEAYIESETYL